MKRVFTSLEDWRHERAKQRLKGLSLGFVPTMGALHEGHLSLIRQSRMDNDKTLVSVFVNPTQFNDPSDFEKYPQRLEDDLKLLEGAGADFALVPRYEELYPDGYRYRVSENDFSHKLCGAHRTGHFDGVLTVVLKLLNLADADRAYFGEKDYQQLELIRGLVRAFFLPVRIEAGATVREANGLAMSSRNLHLRPEHRRVAPEFHRWLSSAAPLAEVREKLTGLGFRIDYLEEMDGRRFGAVYLGDVRLIDNVAL